MSNINSEYFWNIESSSRPVNEKLKIVMDIVDPLKPA